LAPHDTGASHESADRRSGRRPSVLHRACDGGREQAGEVADNRSGAVEGEDSIESGPAETMGERQDEAADSLNEAKEAQADALEDAADAQRAAAEQ
jgi:hypothetical protein